MFATGVYVRISSDPEHDRLGVERQREDCLDLVKQRGWRLVTVYEDDDRSAFSGKPRPAYQQMMADLAAGRINAIVAWHHDRLHRSPAELETFIPAIEAAGAAIATVRAGDLDLSTPSGRAVARTLGAWARFESEHKSDRIRRKLAQNAVTGKPHGGKRRFGYEPGRQRVREPEAAVIREASRRLIAGESLRSIFRDFNARGLYNTRGTPWTHTGIRSILVGPHLAGLRVHRGEIVGKGDWPAILDEPTWRAMVKVLDDPSRVTTPGRAGVASMLAGLAICGVHRTGLFSGTSRGVPSYRCREWDVNRNRAHMDAYVSEVVCRRLSRRDAVELLMPAVDTGQRERAEREADDLDRRMQDAARLFASGSITADQLEAITADLRPQLAEAKAACAPAPDRVDLLGDLVGAGDVRGVWDGLPVERHRAVIAALLEPIVIMRGRKGPGFKTDSIKIRWRSGVGPRRNAK